MDSEQGNSTAENVFLRRWNQQSCIGKQKREGLEAGKYIENSVHKRQRYGSEDLE